MAKTTFASLKLKLNEEVKTLKIEDKEIEIKQYLPLKDKYLLVKVALEQAFEDGVCNEVLLTGYLELYTVFLYTNLTFTDKQKEDEMKLYDLLSCNGIIEKIFELIPASEINFIYDAIENIKNSQMKYLCSFGAGVKDFTQSFPNEIKKATDMIEELNDGDKLKNAKDFVLSVNNGKSLN